MIYASLQILLKLNLLMLTSILVLLSSVDGKRSKHINNVVVKASRQIAVLRKIKLKVSRDFLENIYMTFIRPLLEYSCEVWDSCTVADAGRLEQLQLEAARIVTGLTAYAILSSLYAETGWEKLNTRRKIRKLSLFYNIVKGDTPDYLCDLLPQTVNQANNYNLRNANNFKVSSYPISKFIFSSHYSSLE